MGEEVMEKMTEMPSFLAAHYVLIHGASHGRWCWYKVQTLLESSGHQVTSLDLKGSGTDPSDSDAIFSFADYNQPLLHLLASLPHHHKVILVGHSAGGMSVTEAIHKFPEKIQAAVYVGATMLKLGFQTQQDLKDGAPDLSEFGDVFEIRFGQGADQPPTSGMIKKEFQRKVMYQTSPIEFWVVRFQTPPDCRCGGSNTRPPYQVQPQSPLNQRSIGPGCSSFGNGGLLELGPFRVNSNGKTLFPNKYSWNNVANVIFLESPAGVGFSYGNDSVIYEETGDISTAKDAYTFLVNWFERFPQYKNRDFYLAGESYAGHYVPQLAYTIVQNSKHAKHTGINLKGIIIGNAWINDDTDTAGLYEFLWNHAMYSDDTHAKLQKFCNFSKESVSDECNDISEKALEETGSIDIYNIYAPVCLKTGQDKSHVLDSAQVYDPCSSSYVDTYLNTEEVQKALHAKPKKWASCSGYDWKDSPSTVLPIIQKLMTSKISVWIYSGDVDARIPVTSTKYSLDRMNVPVKTAWRPWYSEKQVGGYTVEYEGLVFVTVRGAGHLVPTYQPQRALTMISSFLKGTPPPQSP